MSRSKLVNEYQQDSIENVSPTWIPGWVTGIVEIQGEM